MSNRYEFTSAATGYSLDMPGSTAEGEWEEPLTNWGLCFGDAGGTALVIEDSLTSLKRLLENALGAVNRRLELEQAGDFREVTADGNRYTVPSGRYRKGMVDVEHIAVRVQEDVVDDDEDDD